MSAFSRSVFRRPAFSRTVVSGPAAFSRSRQLIFFVEFTPFLKDNSSYLFSSKIWKPLNFTSLSHVHMSDLLTKGEKVESTG